MDLAFTLAKQSKDQKMQVGCVITSLDRYHIRGFGYNGGAIGGSNQRDSMEAGRSGMICAEINALVKCSDIKGPNVLFCTHVPCSNCSKIIINAGHLKEVYYVHDYDSNAKEILSKANIKLEKL